MEYPTRQFREQPFCWQEKNILRILRKKYNKKMLPYRRTIYLALTEIESDFGQEFIKNYTKTIATYAGVERHLASKILKEFEQLGIIKNENLRDNDGKFYGKRVYLLSQPMADIPPAAKPPSVKIPHKKIIYNKENNNIYELVNHFFKLKGWDYKENKENEIVYNSYTQPAKQLLKICENNLETAKSKLKEIKDWAESRGLDWSLSTAVKRFKENNAPKQKITKEYYMGNPIFQKFGREYVMGSDGIERVFDRRMANPKDIEVKEI